MATKKATACCSADTKCASKEVAFSYKAPKAKKVAVVGSFNNWDAQKDVLSKATTGLWSGKVKLNPGRYEYKFWVDGNWENDPKASGYVNNAFGSTNCVVDVK